MTQVGVHISEAGASVISDIILDYVKLPLEGDYTTQNKKNKKKRIRSSTSTPGSTDKQTSNLPNLLLIGIRGTQFMSCIYRVPISIYVSLIRHMHRERCTI
jgi:hypothetical protein